jgi:hypothetical protein
MQGAGTQRRGLRPELMILLLLVIAVPIIGWQIYRRVTFEFNELVTALSSHPCAFVYKDKKEYDLSDLSRSKSTCSSSDAEACQDYHVHRVDNDFFFNVCSNAMRKPPECSELFGSQNVQPSIGYQTGDGVCYYMGQLRSGRWSLLDARRPEAGLKLTYTGGSPCDGDTRRSTQFHFECNPDAGKGEPVAVFGDCEFVVTWETALACPIRQTQLLSFLWYVVALGRTMRPCTAAQPHTAAPQHSRIQPHRSTAAYSRTAAQPHTAAPQHSRIQPHTAASQHSRIVIHTRDC